MLPEANFEPLVDELEQALNTGKLPLEYADRGAQLLQRLRQPVSVAVMGGSGAGKSAVIDMMLGRTVIGSNASGIVVEVYQGTREHAIVETADGRQHKMTGTLAQLDIPQNTVRVRQYLTDPQLCWHSYTEIPLAGSDNRMNKTIRQAAAVMDVILWCSTDFGLQERELWAAVPDNVKDHSFLILSMADRQVMRGTLQEHITELEPIAAEEFLGVYPVAALQGLRAQCSGGPEGAKLWRSSGGKQLFDDVMHQVELGRGSDVDQAALLVRRFSANANSLDPSDRAPREVPEKDIFGIDSALTLLQQRAEEMLAEAESVGGADAGLVLNRCLDAVRDLSASLGDPSGVPAMDAAREAAQDGEELLMLCQIEQTEEAAADAVTLLFQLKKELVDCAGAK